MSVYLQDPDVTILHGDALAELRMLGDDSVDCCVTDPPYGDTSLDWDHRVDGWQDEIARVLKPTGSLWCFGSFRFWLGNGATHFADWTYAQEIIWEKHNGSSFHADRFRRVHEFAVQWYRGSWADVWKSVVTTPDATARTVRRKGRPPHTGEIGGKLYTSTDGGPRLQRSVIRVRSCHGRAVHPTQKPEGILIPLIEYACPPDGIVLDPFAGSGSTGVAASLSGRRSLLIDCSEAYCKLAATRLQQQAIEVTDYLDYTSR